LTFSSLGGKRKGKRTRIRKKQVRMLRGNAAVPVEEGGDGGSPTIKERSASAKKRKVRKSAATGAKRDKVQNSRGDDA